MPDLLVRLYDLPSLEAEIARQRAKSTEIRRALAPDKQAVLKWVKRHWGEGWASECDIAFARAPVTCILAVRPGRDGDGDGEKTLGFACYEATCRNYFGPTGVREAAQGQGIGRALLIAALHAMRAQGYAYAIIGGAGVDVQPFYIKSVGAVPIEGSDPGVYGGML